MLRLVDDDTYERFALYANVYDWTGAIPRHDSVGALAVGAVQRSAGHWRLWLVDDTRTAFQRWWGSPRRVPTYTPDLSGERHVAWLNSSVQRGLSVQEAYVPFGTYAGVEIVAHSSCRIFFADRTQLDGLGYGIDPRKIKPRKPASYFTPSPELRPLAELLHARYHEHLNKKLVITREGYAWT